MRKVHQGIRDFECDVCHKSFGERKTLRNHAKAVHGKLSSTVSVNTSDHEEKLLPTSLSVSNTGVSSSIPVPNNRDSNNFIIKPSTNNLSYSQNIKEVHNLEVIQNNIEPVQRELESINPVQSRDSNSLHPNISSNIQRDSNGTMHNNIRFFTCEYCFSNFVDKLTLDNHMRLTHFSSQYFYI